MRWNPKAVSTGAACAAGAVEPSHVLKAMGLSPARVEASLRGWPQAPFQNKMETDANFKRMLHEGMKPENLRAVRLGIASHNLFDLAYGLVDSILLNCPTLHAVQILFGGHEVPTLTGHLDLSEPLVLNKEFIAS